MEKRESQQFFRPDFCALCGALLPRLDAKKFQQTCQVCNAVWPAKETVHRICAVYKYDYEQARQGTDEKEAPKADGPTIERLCNKCGHSEMSYTTRQTRSADEGMTVFFTCTSCGYKEIEYT